MFMPQAIAKFTPQEDITAFEVAGCIPVLKNIFLDIIFNKDGFDALPQGVKRHFTIIELTDAPPADPGDAS